MNTTVDHRDLLEVLKAELAFLQQGGYRNTARAPWRPQFLFQDSPTCLNFDPAQPQAPCANCVLAQLVPAAHRSLKIACRHIPLGPNGETIDSFYRAGTEEELEAAFSQWLKNTIGRLERERAGNSRVCEHVGIHGCAKCAAGG